MRRSATFLRHTSMTRTWNDVRLADWIEQRLAAMLPKADERLIVARILAKEMIETPEFTIRFHRPERIKDKGNKGKQK